MNSSKNAEEGPHDSPKSGRRHSQAFQQRGRRPFWAWRGWHGTGETISRRRLAGMSTAVSRDFDRGQPASDVEGTVGYMAVAAVPTRSVRPAVNASKLLRFKLRHVPTQQSPGSLSYSPSFAVS